MVFHFFFFPFFFFLTELLFPINFESLYLAVMGLHGYMQIFSSFSKKGLLSTCGSWASYCGGFSCCRAQALGHVSFNSSGSRALEHRLNNCGAQA